MSSFDHASMIGRFAAACRADSRIAAAFLGGSRGADTADEHADSDLYLIIYDEAYDEFFSTRREFMGRLGEPVLLEDFNGLGHDMLLYIFADGVEGELVLGRQSHFAHLAGGAFRALLDRDGVLPSEPFPPPAVPSADEVREHARWLLSFFWRDLSQLARWLARERPWTAYHHLEKARETTLSLVRALHGSPEDSYYKIELDVDEADLAPFQATFCRAEREAIVAAVPALLAIYWSVAPRVAAMQGLAYPRRLEQAVLSRLEQACGVAFERGAAFFEHRD